MNSKASRIAEALCARLETIRTAAGYKTEAGANLFRGAAKIPSERLPSLVLIEGEEDVLGQEDDGICRVSVPYTIEGCIACDPANPNDAAHELIADVQRALFSAAGASGGLSIGLVYAGRTIHPREDGSKLVVVQVKLQSIYKLDLKEPESDAK
jgi:hypothetical protein